jgi:hypothetical protein
VGGTGPNRIFERFPQLLLIYPFNQYISSIPQVRRVVVGGGRTRLRKGVDGASILRVLQRISPSLHEIQKHITQYIATMDWARNVNSIIC